MGLKGTCTQLIHFACGEEHRQSIPCGLDAIGISLSEHFKVPKTYLTDAPIQHGGETPYSAPKQASRHALDQICKPPHPPRQHMPYSNMCPQSVVNMQHAFCAKSTFEIFCTVGPSQNPH